MIMRMILRAVEYIFLVFVVGFFVFLLLIQRVPRKTPRLYGVTFVPQAAEALGLDWKEVYRALFDDLGVRNVRISAYWDEIEKEKDSFDYSRLDFQVEEAQRHGARIIFVIGRKVPRWPECHIPEWAKDFTLEEQDNGLFDYMGKVILRYKNFPAIIIWQVENEPFLPFGECPDFGAKSVDAGIALVRSLDGGRPILVTDSGELSIWIRAARRGDIFGTTMYRTVWNKVVGELTYPLPPSFFRFKRAITELVVGQKQMIVIELQGEPWLSRPLQETTIEEHYMVVNPEKFRGILEYAEASGFDTFYLWGVEWWYWLRANGHPEIWEIFKEKLKAVDHG